MAGLHDIKRRIVSVKNTQKITRAMKMVAASKLRRAQEAIVLARPYAHRMRTLVNNLAARAELDLHPLLRSGGDGVKTGLIVITSDRGLCGGFNSTIINTLVQKIETDFSGQPIELTLVGRKGVEAVKRHPYTVRATHTEALDGPLLDTAREIIAGIAEDFTRGGTDRVYCLYNAFKSAITQKVTLEQILPFQASGLEDEKPVDYLYEPSPAAVFDALLSKHLIIQMHRILNESAASEHGARMTAMDSATKNAGEMIDRLTLQYNRARQDAVTTELIEVVSGAEAI